MKSTYKTTISKFLYFSIALVGMTAVSSCKKVDINADNIGTAKVQLVNASTDAGASKLYIDGELRTASSVSYNSGSGYANSYTGLQDVSVQSGSGTTLVTINTQMDAGTYYSYFLAGTSGNYLLIKTQDDVTPATSGKAKVSFVQASPSATLNLLASNTQVFSAQTYKAVTPYNEIPAGTYIFTVTNGTTNTVLATSASVNLVGGKNYTIYTSGSTAVTTGTSALTINVVANN